MNKNQYRIIFNKARGMMIVVAETVTSHGSSGNTTKNRSVDPDDSGVQGQWIALPKPITLTRFSSACILMIGAAFSASLAQAQIVADPSAPKNQQPTVLNTANGLPQVNIQTPNAQGVSVNTYNLFNVDKSGAILNNSRTNTQTQTAGWIQGNPWLANGSAKIILNEVNSSNPSLLNGYIEVAGQRAQVIVANPSGISCDGCGFINTSRATLTTGIPVLNGGNLDSYRVQRGTINITGAGLDTSNADYTDLIAHAVQVNAGVWAKQLNVITGANQVSADNTLTGQKIPITKLAATETAPQYGVDVAQLGGMYAGKITLIGTEAGVGVRSAGTIGASSGDVVITNEGNLENSGKIGSKENSQLQLKGGLTNSGNITSLQNLTLTSGGNTNNSGALNSQQATTITTSSDLSNSGTIYSGGQLNLASSTNPANTVSNSTGGTIHSDTGIDLHSNQLNNQGTLQTNGLATLAVQNDIDNSHGTINVQRLVMTSSHGNLNNIQGVISQTGNSAHDIGLDISGAALSNQKGGIVGQAPISASSGGTGASGGSSGTGNNSNTGTGSTTPSQPVTPPSPLANGILSIAGNITNDAGSILTPGSANLSVTGLNNTGGLMTLGNASVSGAQLVNDQGKLNITGNLTATTSSLSNQGGSILVAKTLTTHNQTLNNAGGTLQAASFGLNASQTLNNANGTITQTGKGSASIIVDGKLNNDQGTIQSAGNLSLTAGSITGSASTLTTQGKLNITSGTTSLNAATVNVAGNAILNTAELDTSHAKIIVNQDLNLNSTSLDNSSGSITAVHNATIHTTAFDTATAESLNNNSGSIQAGNALNITVHDTLDNTLGTLAATGTSSQLTISANQLDNTSGVILQKGIANTTLNVTNDLYNDGSTSAGLIKTAGNLNINAGSISGTQGTITTLKNLNLNSGTTSFNSGTVNVQGNARLTIGPLDNTAGKIIVNGSLTATTAGDLTNTHGQITAVHNTSIETLGSLDNTSGLIQSGKVLTLNSTRAITNNLGIIEALGTTSQLNIHAQSLDNASGVISQTGAANTTINVADNLNNGGTSNSAHNKNGCDGECYIPASDAITSTYGPGLIETAGNLTINAGRISGTQGAITTLKNLSLTSGITSFNRGKVNVLGDANLTTGALNNTSGKILVNGKLTANTDDLTNTHGLITAVKNASIQTQGNLDNTSGLIQSGQVLALSSTGTITNNLGTIEALGTKSQLNIQAQSLDNANGVLRQTGGTAHTTINIDDNLNNGGTASLNQSQNECNDCAPSDAVIGTISPGLIETAGNLAINAGSISGTQGVITTLKNLTLTSGTTSFNSGTVNVQGNAALTTGTLDNTLGHVLVNGTLNLDSSGDITNTQGVLSATNAVRITGQNNLGNVQGQITSSHQSVTINTIQNIDNGTELGGGQITAATDVKLQGHRIDSEGTIYAGKNTTITAADTISNHGGIIAALGNTTLHATTGAIRSSGTLAAGLNPDGTLSATDLGNLTLTAPTITATGIILAPQNITATGGSVSLASSQTNAKNIQLIATKGNIDLNHATVTAAKTFTATTNSNINQELINDSGHLSADTLAIQASNISNVSGEMAQTGSSNLTLAAQTASGTIGTINNSHGLISTPSQNLTLLAHDLRNDDTGEIKHAGTGKLLINTDHLEGSSGQIKTNGTLNLNVTGNADLSSGMTTAATQLTVNAGSLNNKTGHLIQTGNAAAQINVTGSLDNSAGEISSNGNTKIGVGSLNNQAGSIKAASINSTMSNLTLISAGLVNNSSTGKILSSGSTTLTADSLNNNHGILNASQKLTATISGDVNNTAGNLGAVSNVNLTAQTLENSQGLLASKNGSLTLSTKGVTNNSNGTIGAATSATLTNQRLINNTQGKIDAETLSINTQSGTLDNNNGGQLSGAHTLHIDSAALNNDTGLIQTTTTNSTLSINTHGQQLTNTNSGSTAGISSQGTLTLTTGNLNNQAGFIGATQDLSATSGNITNTQGGQISSSTNVHLTGTGLNNIGGKVQTETGDVTLTMGNGTVDNTNSLIQAGQAGGTVSITAGKVINDQTSGSQGIQGKDVTINTRVLSNQNGHILANKNIGSITITASQTVNNQAGTISAGHDITVQDAGLNNKTLVATNTNGTMIAGHDLTVDAHSATLDGSLLALHNLTLTTDTDLNFTNNGTTNAANTANISTHGNVTNSADSTHLSAGNTLSVTAVNINNTAQGTFNSGNTILNAQQTVTNRGLINSSTSATGSNGETYITGNTINNLGTGRIYGDHVAIAAQTLNNSPEGTSTPVIASRNNMDLGVQVLNNQKDAKILSLGDLTIGGSLDGNHQATGQAQSITNNGATIDVTGNLNVHVNQLTNSNSNFTTKQVTLPTTKHIVSLLYNGQTYDPSVVSGTFTTSLDQHNQSYYDQITSINGVSVALSKWTVLDYTKSETDTVVATSQPGLISVGGNFNGTVGQSFTNDKSQILVGGNVVISSSGLPNVTGVALKNIEATAQNTITDKGSSVYSYSYKKCKTGGIKCSHRRAYDSTPYLQTSSYTVTLPITATAPTVTIGSTSINTVTQTASNTTNSTGGANTKQVVNTKAVITESTAAQNQGVSANGIETANNMTDIVNTGALQSASDHIGNDQLNIAHGAVNNSDTASGTHGQVNGGNVQATTATVNINSTPQVSTTVPSLKIPNNALYTSNPYNPTQPFVVTDPAFTNHNSWLSSDYMLHALSLDPNQIQKRLGDGFYEQQLIQQQVGQLTGRRFLNGYSSDASEYQALMDNGVTFAQVWGLTPGIALTSAQMAQLTSDIVWMVSQTITLPDGSIQQALVPQIYVRTNSTDLKSDGTLISANNIIGNLTGDLNNSGTIAGRQVVSLTANNINNLGGRIQGEQVGLTAKQDINNIGGTITADQKLTLDAGHDVNITTTTQSTANKVGLSDFSQTTVDRVAGLYVGNTANPATGGLLSVHAGNNVNLTAADIANQSKGGTTQIRADNNVNLNTITTAVQDNMVRDAKNYVKSGNSQDVGTKIQSQGDLKINAGNTIKATAVQLSSVDGNIQLHGAQGVTLDAGQTTENFDSASVQKRKGFLGSTKTTTQDQYNSTTLVGNTITAGQKLSITTDQGDIGVTASTLQAGGDALLKAQNGSVTLNSGVNKSEQSLVSNSNSAIKYSNHQEGKITQTLAQTSIQSGGNTSIQATDTVNLNAVKLQAGQTLQVGNASIAQDTNGNMQLDANGKPIINSGTLNNLSVGTVDLHNESWNATQSGYKGPVKELMKVVAVAEVIASSGIVTPKITIGSSDSTHTTADNQAVSTVQAQDVNLGAKDVHLTGTQINAQHDDGSLGTTAVLGKNITFDTAVNKTTTTTEHGLETVSAEGTKIKKDELQSYSVSDSKNTQTDTTTTTTHQGVSINSGNIAVLGDIKNGSVNLTSAKLNADADQGTLLLGAKTTQVGGIEDTVTKTHNDQTETTTVSAAVRHVAVDVVEAEKAVIDALLAVKKATSALKDAKDKIARGELSSDSLTDYEANLAAATLNLGQAEIALGSTAATAANSASTLGFTANGTATHTTTSNTNTQTQGTWNGSELNGAVVDLTGSKFTGQGLSSTSKTLLLNTDDLTLTAGTNHGTSSSSSSSNSQTVTASSAGNVGGSISTSKSKSSSESNDKTNSTLTTDNVQGKLNNLTLDGGVIKATSGKLIVDTLEITTQQNTASGKNSSSSMSAGMGGSSAGVSSGSLGFSLGKGKSDSALATDQSGIIFGSDDHSLTVNHTVNNGGIIAHIETDPTTGKPIDKNLNFTTNTLTTSDIHDHSTSSQSSIGLNVGINNAKSQEKDPKTLGSGTATINTSRSGHDLEQITHATIGNGAVVTSDQTTGQNSLANVNRSINTATETTKNQATGGLNANVTVDTRVFTEAGRKDIVNEQENLGTNLKKTAAITASDGLAAGAIYAGLTDDHSGNNTAKAAANVQQVINNLTTGSSDQTTDLVAKTREIAKGDDGKLTNVVDNQETLNDLNGHLAAGTKADNTDINLTTNMTNQQGQDVQETTNVGNGKDTYLDVNHLDNTVDNVNHAIAHQNGQGEASATLQGDISTNVFNLGAWANSGAISTAQGNLVATPITTNNDAAAQQALLNANNVKLGVQQALGDNFEDRQPSLVRAGKIDDILKKNVTTHSAVVFDSDKGGGLAPTTIANDLKIAGKCQTDSECKTKALQLNKDGKEFFIVSNQDDVKTQAAVLLTQLGSDVEAAVRKSPELQNVIMKILYAGKNQDAVDISNLYDLVDVLASKRMYADSGTTAPKGIWQGIKDAHNVSKAGQLDNAINSNSTAYPQDIAIDDLKVNGKQIDAVLTIANSVLTVADLAFIGKNGLTAFSAMKAEQNAAKAELVAAKIENNINRDADLPNVNNGNPNAPSDIDLGQKKVTDSANGTANPHYDTKHGSYTTDQQQYDRAMNGIDPSTGKVSKSRPDASKFFNSTDMQTAITQAEKQYAANPSGYDPQKGISIDFNRPVGNGYVGDNPPNIKAGLTPGEYRWSNTATVRIDLKTGKAYTAYPNIQQGVPKPDPRLIGGAK